MSELFNLAREIFLMKQTSSSEPKRSTSLSSSSSFVSVGLTGAVTAQEELSLVDLQTSSSFERRSVRLVTAESQGKNLK